MEGPGVSAPDLPFKASGFAAAAALIAPGQRLEGRLGFARLSAFGVILDDLVVVVFGLVDIAELFVALAHKVLHFGHVFALGIGGNIAFHKVHGRGAGKYNTYDGLYTVEKHTYLKGISGHMVYRFMLKRLGGQKSAVSAARATAIARDL